MKIIFKDYKAGELKVQAENKDDLWALSQIIEAGDIVIGRTTRKVKMGSSDAKESVVKKTVTLSIAVEKTEYTADMLRVSGIVKEGPEDVPSGSHHTIEVEEQTIVKIVKPKWLKYQVDRIEDATKEKASVIICILDRGEAGFALLKPYGYEWLSEFEGEVSKKGLDEKKESRFYDEASDLLADYMKRHNAEKVIIASPAFWKDELLSVLKKKHMDIAKKAVLATCNHTGREGLNEVLKRPEVKTALSEQRAAKEVQLVDELMKEIGKEGNAAYGLKDVKDAASAGAVATLLVTDKLIQKAKNDNNFTEIDSIMRMVDHSKGEVVIVSSGHEGGKELEGLGGIGALLRYKVKY
ncbi:MAG TPA: mRNA surveillance protein pelota [Nanoarchaeota archaeon]|nr:mRNA surveillance protein pelota [Nanoarchaeota archaeon]